jgi:hypothetical protein
MNIDKLVDLLEDKGFQDPRTGNLFFGAYIYTYDPKEEYTLQSDLKKLTQRLKRPNNFLDCLTIDIYEFFIEYLKSHRFGQFTFFEEAMEQEKENPEKAYEYLLYEIENDDFYTYLEKKIKTHFEGEDDKKVYLLIHGIGQVYPYLRASTFLKRTEALIKNFKIIVFYPGAYNENEYALFNELRTDNMYRVTLLNNLIAS